MQCFNIFNLKYDFLAPVGFLRREVDLGQYLSDSRPTGKGWTRQ